MLKCKNQTILQPDFLLDRNGCYLGVLSIPYFSILIILFEKQFPINTLKHPKNFQLFTQKTAFNITKANLTKL